MSNHPEYYEASNFTKNLACSGLSEVESSIVKATFEDDSIPKEKHVISLLRLSDFDTSFFTPLFRRISTRNYRVVFKTLLVFHRLTRDGPLHNIKALETKTQFFNQLCSFQSRDSPVHSRVVRLYSAYWVEKIASYAASKRSVERESPADAKTWALVYPLADVLVLLPALQKQMDKLLLVDPGVPFIDPNLRYFFNLLLRDSMRLYNVCNIFLYQNLKNIETMDRTQTAIFLQCCRNSVSIDERYIAWHKTLNRIRLANESLPAFQKLPENIFNLLEEQLAAHDRNAGVAPGDGNRIAIDYAISSTKNQAQTASNAPNATFHNDKMAASPTVASSLSAKTGYSNQQPAKQQAAQTTNGAKVQTIDEFTFDAFNDSEWAFDNNTTTTTNNNNNGQRGNASNDPFASPQISNNNNNNNNQFNNNNNMNNNNNFQNNNNNNNFNNHTQFSPQPIQPAPANSDPFAAFDAFNDAVPVQQTTQIKTTKTGVNSAQPNNTQNQINNMYSPSVTSNQGFASNPSSPNPPMGMNQNNNMNMNGGMNMNNGNNNGYPQGHRASTAQPPPYEDDPFSGLVNNNTPYQQPAMVVMAAPMYPQPMYTNGYQQPMGGYQQQPYPNQQQQWNNGGNMGNNGGQQFNQGYQQPNQMNQQQFNNNNNNNQMNYNHNNNNQQQQQQRGNNNNNNNNNAFDLPF